MLNPALPLGPLMRSVRPEARGGLHIVEQSLWAAVPQYMRRLSAALKKHTGHDLPLQVGATYVYLYNLCPLGGNCGAAKQQQRNGQPLQRDVVGCHEAAATSL